MSNSPLVNVTRLSPNYTEVANKKNINIIPHHTAGVLSVEAALEWFSRPSTQASCNYVVGNDGRIGLCVPEDKRAWTTSSRAADSVSVTIEVVNSSTGGEWPISDAAWKSLVNLCADICKRNGIKKLNYTGDKNGNLQMHKWYANTNCPGPYLASRFPKLAAEVNAKLEKQEEIDMNEKELIDLIDKRITAKLVGENTKPAQWIVDSKELEEAVAAGITDGTRPGGYAKREEVAAMVLREHKSVMSKATDAAAEAVKTVLDKIKGVL